MTGSDQSRDSGHSRESGDTSEAETVYDCIKSDLQVDNAEDEEDDDDDGVDEDDDGGVDDEVDTVYTG